MTRGGAISERRKTGPYRTGRSADQHAEGRQQEAGQNPTAIGRAGAPAVRFSSMPSHMGAEG
jgi:hypothetical protein